MRSTQRSRSNTQYFSRPLADETDWTAALAGSLDVGRSKLDAGYSHLALNLDPEQLGTLGVVAPAPYTDDDGRLDADIVLGRVRLIPAFDLQNLVFGSAASEPAPQSSEDLDRLVVTATLTGLVELSNGPLAGALSVPLLGDVPATGLTETGLRAEIADELRSRHLMTEPSVGGRHPLSSRLRAGRGGASGRLPLSAGADDAQRGRARRGLHLRGVKDSAMIVRTAGVNAVRGRIDPDGFLEPGDVLTIGERFF